MIIKYINDLIIIFLLTGSCIGNRTFASLITFLKENQIERLFLMDQHEEQEGFSSHFLSTKLTGKFIEVISDLTELSLNSNLFGNSWIDHLVEFVTCNSTIKYLR